MSENQKTLKKEYIFVGKGLHSGLKVNMRLSPAPVNTGIRFHRTDLGPDAVIEALTDYVTDTRRGTTLEKGQVRVSTLEHLMSALYGLGVDNALVSLDSFEVPILDGSAFPYVQAICADGLQEKALARAVTPYQKAERRPALGDELKIGEEGANLGLAAHGYVGQADARHHAALERIQDHGRHAPGHARHSCGIGHGCISSRTSSR